MVAIANLDNSQFFVCVLFVFLSFSIQKRVGESSRCWPSLISIMVKVLADKARKWVEREKPSGDNPIHPKRNYSFHYCKVTYEDFYCLLYAHPYLFHFTPVQSLYDALSKGMNELISHVVSCDTENKIGMPKTFLWVTIIVFFYFCRTEIRPLHYVLRAALE